MTMVILLEFLKQLYSPKPDSNWTFLFETQAALDA